MSEGRRYLVDSARPIRTERRQPFIRNGKLARASEKNREELLCMTEGACESEDFGLNHWQRSASLNVLHAAPGSYSAQQQPLEPRMAQLETLEAKMASIEVSLSSSTTTTAAAAAATATAAALRRKKGSSISGAGMTSLTTHRSKEQYNKEIEVLRVALKDKENIIQTLKGQLCNTLSSRLALHNGPTPLSEADRKATEERLQRLRREAENKRLAIKNLKLALDRLDITDNIDTRIQQAELEYRLGREELELLTLREEIRSLQAAVELAETRLREKSDTIFSCISGSTEVTVHAIEISADPKSPRFGAGPRDDVPGLYVDWAVEDSGLCKGDRLVEVNGKTVVGGSRADLARLLAVAPDAAQIVVLRGGGESLAALRALRSDNLRLTHRIGYLEEQLRDLLAAAKPTTEPPTEAPAGCATTAMTAAMTTAMTAAMTTAMTTAMTSATRRDARQDHLQVFQKGPDVTTLLTDFTADTVGLPAARADWHRMEKSTEQRQKRQLRKSSDGLPSAKRSPPRSRSQSKWPVAQAVPLAGHTRSSPRSSSQLRSLDFDSEPIYYRPEGTQFETTMSGAYVFQEPSSRPVPPKKPLRLSLHRAASLQSVESAPPTTLRDASRKSASKRQRGGHLHAGKYQRKEGSDENRMEDPGSNSMDQSSPRAPSRAESCQSALRWPSSKTRPRPRPPPPPPFATVSSDKWC